MGADRGLRRFPEFFVDVGIDVLDHLPCGGVVTEYPHRLTHLLQPFVAVGQVPCSYSAQIIEFGPMARQHRTSAQPLKPLQRIEVVDQAAILVIDDGRSAAKNGVGGEHRIIENEAHRIGGMTRGGQHGDAQPGGVDHLAVAQVPTHVPQESATHRPDSRTGGRSDLVDATGVVSVAMADEHQRDSPQRRQPLKVVILIRSRVNDDDVIATGTAQHPGVGALQRHRAGVFAQQDGRRLGDRPQHAVGGRVGWPHFRVATLRHAGHLTSTMSSTSTGASKGSSETPTAERA